MATTVNEILLNPEETEALLDILKTYRSDLRMEIVDTDNPIYKRPLKHRRDVLDAIVEKLHLTTGVAADAPGEDAPPAPMPTLRIIAVF